MDNHVSERDIELLESDKYTFFVLGRVMTGECGFLRTDHKSVIICYTCQPFPLWIWTADGIADDWKEEIYQIVRENFLAKGEYRINLKYELAQYFLPRAKQDGFDLSIITNMHAYDCPRPVEPEIRADGQLYQCRQQDADELAEFIFSMSDELNIDRKSLEEFREDARQEIETGTAYFWKNSEGINVCSCKYTPNGQMASINRVFTRPQYRRRHYAQNLVYAVTKIVRDQDMMAMLYTDADYEASNACYEKIGYVLRGKLCTIG